jgi:predicted transcriptional regulator
MPLSTKTVNTSAGRISAAMMSHVENLILLHPGITTEQLEDIGSVSSATIYRAANYLVEVGVIKRKSEGRSYRFYHHRRVYDHDEFNCAMVEVENQTAEYFAGRIAQLEKIEAEFYELHPEKRVCEKTVAAREHLAKTFEARKDEKTAEAVRGGLWDDTGAIEAVKLALFPEETA